MIELSISLIILGIALSVIGLAYKQSIFTFVSGFVFLLLGFTSENTYILVIMILLSCWQFFSAFFEFGRG